MWDDVGHTFIRLKPIFLGVGGICDGRPGRGGGVSWDPHFSSFDGNAYDSHGLCPYVLLKPCHTLIDFPYFELKAKNQYSRYFCAAFNQSYQWYSKNDTW